jgi:hypothetical protein
MKPVLRLHREVAGANTGTVEPLADLVIAEDRNQADSELVGEAVINVGKGAKSVDMRRAVANSARVVGALGDHVVEVRLDQHMTVGQRVCRWCQQRPRPPGIVERLMSLLRRTHFLSYRQTRRHRRQGENIPHHRKCVSGSKKLHSLVRVKDAVQLGSQFLPPSVEKACSVRNDVGVRSEKTKRTKMDLP